MTLKALLFDVDGTLAETEEAHRQAFNEAFSKAGLDWHWDQALYHELLGVTGGRERILFYVERAKLDKTDFPPERIAALHQQKTEIYVKLVDDGLVHLRPGIRELLEEARSAKLRLAITTTTSRVNVDRLLRATIGDHALDWFDVYATGERVRCKKPDPEVYRLALSDLNLPASACLAIEDARQGLLAALAAGIKTIVTESAYSAGQDFEGALQVIGLQDSPPTLEDLRRRFVASADSSCVFD